MSEIIKKGEQLFSIGNYSEARECFSRAIDEIGENKIAYNNLGVIAFKENRLGEAADYLKKALNLDPEYSDARDNLQFVEDLLGKAEQQAAQSDQIPSREIDYHLKNTKIGIINAWENKFNQIYSRYFLKNNEVRLVIPRAAEELISVIEWADIIWSTWCNEPVLVMSKQRIPAKLVTHIRSYEILMDNFMTGINWANIDGAIFVADHIRQIANEMWSEQLAAIPQTMIHNCVELDKYPFYEKRPGKNICYVGYLNHKKGVGLLLQCLQVAVREDSEYCLHVAGTHQEVRFKVYMEHLIKEMGLENHVEFHGWVKNVPALLRDMDYVISTSPWEGCPNNVIEAMACGVKPLIHNWRGARDIFPDEFVFNSIPEFLEILKSPDYDSRSYRAYCEKNFNARIQVNKMDAFLEKILKSD